jgi:acyl-CoA synthetase (AMP-forming)/AMP-acid ligase II
MARQKIPERLLLLDELPRNASGKVQKFRLRELTHATAVH